MKQNFLILFMLVLSQTSFGQIEDVSALWRTNGVHDAKGNFIERAKIQSFLFSAAKDQFYRLDMQDRMNMSTGETKAFVSTDTLLLRPLKEKTFQLNEKESLTFHTSDSLTIRYNDYFISYTKLPVKQSSVSLRKFRNVLMNTPFLLTQDGETKYRYIYQENELSKISVLEGKSQWESHYQIIDFNGFLILQGIVSAPKLILSVKKNKIEFLETDYRFKSKKGFLLKEE